MTSARPLLDRGRVKQGSDDRGRSNSERHSRLDQLGATFLFGGRLFALGHFRLHVLFLGMSMASAGNLKGGRR